MVAYGQPGADLAVRAATHPVAPMSHRRALLAAAILSGITTALQAQVNGYAEVTGLAGTTLTIGSVNETNGTFEDGTEAILMQMQDDVIGANLLNNAAFGNISTISSAGFWEPVTILSHTEVGSIPTSVTIAAPASHVFHFGAKCAVQLITYPQRGTPDFITTAPMTALPWNGVLGGVLAFQVTGVFTIAHNLRADGAGFQGGVPSTNLDAACAATPYTSALTTYGEKGGGIQRKDIATYSYARGKFSNAGGGGNPDNAGGGGGGNMTIGGGGGGGYGCLSGGLPGLNLNAWILADRFFMGGGGGGGQQNNGVGGAGGAGGGIIIVKMQTLKTVGPCAGVKISANGSDGQSSVGAPPDGAGAGGAGGSIYLFVNTLDIDPTCAVTCEANGGNGGGVTNTDPYPGNWIDCGGGGGGGGQGLVMCGGGAGGSGGSGWAGMSGFSSSGSGGTHDPGGGHAPDGPGADGAGVIGFPGSPGLPVELLAFTGRPVTEGVWLEWATATEHNSASFRIHRSADGITWDQVAQTPAAGESQSSIQYTELDRSPLPGLAYYLLEQIDLDGTATTYPMIAVDRGKQQAIGAAPNPADDHLTLTSGEDGPLHVTLTDPMGRVVLKLLLNAGERTVPLATLVNGSYRMTVTGASGELLRTTMIVQH